MSNGCRVVFLLHGVDTDLDAEQMPAWYSPVRRELQAFYDVIALRYRSYDRFGKVLVTTFRGAIFAALLVALPAIFIGHFSRLSFIVATSMVVIGLTISGLERLRRRAVVAQVAAQMAGRDGLLEAHAIAHSFGTYVLSRAFERTMVSAQHVVLTGCVLSQRFNWDRLWKHRGDGARPFLFVRNECSREDNVVMLAGRAAIFTGLGRAGELGFEASRRPEAPPVHNVPGPWGRCSASSRECDTAPMIHNFALQDYAHSDVFLSGDHARQLWLPTFWGFDPSAFKDFVIRCAELIERNTSPLLSEAMGLYEDIGDERYPWFSIDVSAPKSIRTVAMSEARLRGVKVTPEQLTTITQKTCESIVAGWQQPDHPERRLAFPRNALGWTIKSVLDMQ